MKIIPSKNKIIKSNIYIIILSLVLTTLIINALAHIIKDVFANSDILNFTLITFQQIFLVLWIWYFIKKNIFPNFKKLFKLPSIKVLFLEITKTYFYLIMFGILLGVLKYNLNLEIPGFSQQKDILGLFPQSGILFYLTLLNATVIAPIIEELIFRGALLTNLCKKYSNLTSILISSLIFSLIHFQPEVFGAIFLISLLLSRLFLKTNSLVAPIMFHILNNTLKTILTL